MRYQLSYVSFTNYTNKNRIIFCSSRTSPSRPCEIHLTTVVIGLLCAYGFKIVCIKSKMEFSTFRIKNFDHKAYKGVRWGNLGNHLNHCSAIHITIQIKTTCLKVVRILTRFGPFLVSNSALKRSHVANFTVIHSVILNKI